MSWNLDPAHSSIQFSVRHMMISTVRGRFEEFSGTFVLNEDNPTDSSIDVVINSASLSTLEDQRDTHLRSPDFLDTEKYPNITFRSTRIEQVDEHHGRLIGDLTVKDGTNEVILDVEYAGQAKSPYGTTSAGFTASTKINRKDWELVWNQALETGGVLVGDEVIIDIEIELIKQDES